MNKLIILIPALLALCFVTTVCTQTTQTNTTPPVVIIETTHGTMEVTLNPEKAPVTVDNFLSYTKEGFYDGTVFHRVVQGFVIQGGGFTRDMVQKPIKRPIRNEADNGLSNKRGTIAMARTPDINSATSQFYINVRDNLQLDHRSTSPGEFGYAVFGEVTKGLEVVDRIAEVETNSQSVPTRPVIIRSVKLKE